MRSDEFRILSDLAAGFLQLSPKTRGAPFLRCCRLSRASWFAWSPPPTGEAWGRVPEDPERGRLSRGLGWFRSSRTNPGKQAVPDRVSP